MRTVNLFIKRLIDVLGSFIGLLIIFPILTIIALLIKITSKGSILFKQERLGKDGQIFNILKFRTMILNAESIGDGLTIKNEKDNRITKMGRFLRSLSLDELPQLINVLKGEMSLVGPRPPVRYYPYDGYESYPEWAKNRFTMKPGITGLSQVVVRNSVPWDDRMLVDIEYIEKFNVWLDIKILIKTIFKTFKSQNIYMDKSQQNISIEIKR